MPRRARGVPRQTPCRQRRALATFTEAITMSSWMTGTGDAGGGDIHYLRTGGSGPPLILLHGLIGNRACWSPVARCLEADFDVVMPDARRHGKSSTPLHGYRYDDH